MTEATQELTVRLPHADEHVPRNGTLPDGAGLPVRVDYEDPPVGRVVRWTDNGDGTAEAVIELPSSLVGELAGDLSVGLDALGKVTHEGDQVVVHEISKILGLGVWTKHTRPVHLYGDDVTPQPGA